MSDSFDHRLVISTLKSQLATAEQEKAALHVSIERLERSYMSIRDSPNVDSALRSEIARLAGQIESLESTLSKLKFENNKQRVEIADHSKSAEKLMAQNQEYLKLKDQIQEFKQAADKLQKAEALIEKYKLRIQENIEYKNHCELLEKNISDLTIKYNQREDHYKTLSEIKPKIERYKLQITEMEERMCETDIENGKLKTRVEKAEKIALLHQSEQKIANKKILELEERLAETSFRSNEVDPQKIDVHRDLLEKNKQLEKKLKEAEKVNQELLTANAALAESPRINVLERYVLFDSAKKYQLA
jgi:protein HOOK3